jgi:hypothetical protein
MEDLTAAPIIGALAGSVFVLIFTYIVAPYLYRLATQYVTVDIELVEL